MGFNGCRSSFRQNQRAARLKSYARTLEVRLLLKRPRASDAALVDERHRQTGHRRDVEYLLVIMQAGGEKQFVLFPSVKCERQSISGQNDDAFSQNIEASQNDQARHAGESGE